MNACTLGQVAAVRVQQRHRHRLGDVLWQAFHQQPLLHQRAQARDRRLPLIRPRIGYGAGSSGTFLSASRGEGIGKRQNSTFTDGALRFASPW